MLKEDELHEANAVQGNFTSDKGGTYWLEKKSYYVMIQTSRGIDVLSEMY